MPRVRAETQSFEFQIWERLRVTVGSEKSEGIYTCRVSDIQKDRLIISRPQFERGNSLLADNRTVTVYSTRADAAYAFSARIKETQPKSQDVMYLLDLGPVRRVQRRRFVRLLKVIPIKHKILQRPLTRPIVLPSSGSVKSKTLDLSAGGALIEVKDEIVPESLLLLVLGPCDLKNLPPHMLAVCRHGRVNELGQRVAGLEFILQEDIRRYLSESELKQLPEALTRFDDHMQNGLVSEIFAEQLMMRKKGLL